MVGAPPMGNVVFASIAILSMSFFFFYVRLPFVYNFAVVIINNGKLVGILVRMGGELFCSFAL